MYKLFHIVQLCAILRARTVGPATPRNTVPVHLASLELTVKRVSKAIYLSQMTRGTETYKYVYKKNRVS
jgi:hypothetical protein